MTMKTTTKIIAQTAATAFGIASVFGIATHRIAFDATTGFIAFATIALAGIIVTGTIDLAKSITNLSRIKKAKAIKREVSPTGAPKASVSQANFVRNANVA